MFVFKKLFGTHKPVDYNDDYVDRNLILIIYKNADDDGKVKIKHLGYLWEKAVGSIWQYNKSFSKYIKGSEAYKFHKGPRAGTHEVSLSQDIITMSKVNHLIKEEQNKYRNYLFKCIKEGNLKHVKTLIEEKGIDDNIQDKNGDKPIHYATRYEKVGILKYLCEERDIDPNEKNKFGESPVFFAVKNKNVYCLQYLVEEKNVSIDMKDGIGIKPLFFPIKEGKLEHVKILLNKENINDFLCGDDYTPLQLAAHWSKVKIVRWLIKKFKNLDIGKRNKEGKSAFDFSKDEEINEIIKREMKRKGISIHKKQNKKRDKEEDEKLEEIEEDEIQVQKKNKGNKVNIANKNEEKEEIKEELEDEEVTKEELEDEEVTKEELEDQEVTKEENEVLNKEEDEYKTEEIEEEKKEDVENEVGYVGENSGEKNEVKEALEELDLDDMKINLDDMNDQVSDDELSEKKEDENDDDVISEETLFEKKMDELEG